MASLKMNGITLLFRAVSRLVFIALLLLSFTLSLARSAWAKPALRYQVAQRGDIAVFGNTLGYDCRPVTPAPTAGSVDMGACGSNSDDNDIDVLWRSDEPATGQSVANTSITPTMARSTAVLKLPMGALTSYARIYWSAIAPKGSVSPAAAIVVERPGVFTKVVPADTSGQSDVVTAGTHYQQSADITSLVQLYGPGPYRVSGVVTVSPVNQADQYLYAAWSTVVFYTLKTDSPRCLLVHEGFDEITGASGTSTTLSGFLVPQAGYDAKLAIVAYQGDADATGDRISVNGTLLTNALNPITNFFNGTQTSLGQAVSNAGDLPQTNGQPASMSGIDIDLVDLTPLVKIGDKSIDVAASTTNDTFFIGTLTGSVVSLTEVFSSSQLEFQNLSNPGGSVRPSAKLQFTVTVPNTGSDTSVDTYVTVPLPFGLTYVPGSIMALNGPNSGARTDKPGDDPAEYDPVTRTIKIRIGIGASSTKGGSIALNDTPPLVQYQVTVDPGADGTDITTSAVVTSSGMIGSVQGLPPANWNTGSIVTPLDGPGKGAPMFYPNHPITIPVRTCQTNLDCPLTKPRCDVANSGCSNSCIVDSDCRGIGIGMACTSAKICGCANDSDCLSNSCNPVFSQCRLLRTDIILAMKPYVNGGNELVRLEFEIFNRGPDKVPAGSAFTYIKPVGLASDFGSVDARWQCNELDRIVTCISTNPILAGQTSSLVVNGRLTASELSFIVNASIVSNVSSDVDLSNNSIHQMVYLDNESAKRDGLYLNCTMNSRSQFLEWSFLKAIIIFNIIALMAFIVRRSKTKL